MELRTAASPRDVKHYTTERLREEFLIDDLFQPDVIKLVYSHIDRIITGSAVPVKETLKLTAGDELRAQYFCERRELGVINIGGAGVITIDGKEYNVAHKEGMYIGMGSKDISFASENADAPAKFYLNSAPAHMTYPTVLIKPEGTPEDGVVIVKDCNKVELGSLETANHRTICKYILPGQVESCQQNDSITKPSLPPFCVCPVSFLFLFSYPLIFSNLPSLLLFLTTFLSAKYPIRCFFLLG